MNLVLVPSYMQTFKMKKLLKTIALALLILIMLLLVKNNYSFMLLNNATYGSTNIINKGQINNLFIGSSMFRQGIDIQTLQDNKEDNYILSYNGNSPYLEYYELLNLLDNNVKIHNLYIDMYVYSMYQAPKISDEKLLLEFNIKQKKEILSKIGGSFSLLYETYVTSNNEFIITYPINNQIVNGIFYKGGSLLMPSGQTSEVLDNSYIYNLSGDMDPIQEEYLIKLIKLANENNINLTFIETPKYKTVKNNESYQEAMEKYKALLDNLDVKYIINSDESYSFLNDNPEYYFDNIHLSYKGRVAFTNILLNYIN